MHLTLNAPSGRFAWVCSEEGTRALLPGSSLHITYPGPIKVAILRLHEGRVERDSVRFFEVVVYVEAHKITLSKKVTTHRIGSHSVQCFDGDMRDITAAVVSKAHKDAEMAETAFAKTHQKLQARYSVQSPRDYAYIHRHMIEADLPAKMHVSLLNGHPLIASGLREWRDDKLVLQTFDRCLFLAKAVANFAPAAVMPLAIGTVQEALFVYALRMFAGVYRKRPEREDDRTLPGTKLYTSFDCDDMALCTAALATRLSAVRRESLDSSRLQDPFSAESLVACVLISEVAVVQGMTCEDGGHTWGYLDLLNGRRLHVESTQLFSPHIGKLDDVYGRGVFLLRPGERMDHTISGVKEIDFVVYKRVCAVYTGHNASIPTCSGAICCSLESLLLKHCKLHPVVAMGVPDPIVHKLRATPTPYEIQAVVNGVPGASRMLYLNGHPHSYMHGSMTSIGLRQVTSSDMRCLTITPANVMCVVDASTGIGQGSQKKAHFVN